VAEKTETEPLEEEYYHVSNEDREEFKKHFQRFRPAP